MSMIYNFKIQTSDKQMLGTPETLSQSYNISQTPQLIKTVRAAHFQLGNTPFVNY